MVSTFIELLQLRHNILDYIVWFSYFHRFQFIRWAELMQQFQKYLHIYVNRKLCRNWRRAPEKNWEKLLVRYFFHYFIHFHSFNECQDNRTWIWYDKSRPVQLGLCLWMKTMRIFRIFCNSWYLLSTNGAIFYSTFEFFFFFSFLYAFSDR